MEKPNFAGRWFSMSERLPEDSDVSAIVALLADAPNDDLRMFVCDADFVRSNAGEFTHWVAIPPLPLQG